MVDTIYILSLYNMSTGYFCENFNSIRQLDQIIILVFACFIFKISTCAGLSGKYDTSIKSNNSNLIFFLTNSGNGNASITPLIVDFIQYLEKENIFKDKIVTEVNNIGDFYVAEQYHHDYFTKNPENSYCQAVINPKLAKLRLSFGDLISE